MDGNIVDWITSLIQKINQRTMNNSKIEFNYLMKCLFCNFFKWTSSLNKGTNILQYHIHLYCVNWLNEHWKWIFQNDSTYLPFNKTKLILYT